MPEQTSTNDNAQVEQVAQRVAEVNLQPSKPSFKVHKSLFDFAIPLIQFANAGINQHHAIHVTVIIFNPVSSFLFHAPSSCLSYSQRYGFVRDGKVVADIS